MTIEINLLSWRERRRERRSRRFYLAVIAFALLGAAGGLGLTYHVDDRLDAQKKRNAFIREQTQRLEGDIRLIGETESIQQRMSRQIEVFSDLQQGRSLTVLVLRDLAVSLVDGVHYTQLSRQGDQLHLSGQAESNHHVSEQLRSLAAAPAFAEPVLSEVESDGGPRRRFSLGINQLVRASEPSVAAGEEVP
ncbi:PilN domain-containing protein [Halomonas sp. E14]|uniref:PilN domain-containing protein n=1 Tax=Halomonas sp. E14 TaxID=3397245 RepID=UPI00403E4321